MDVLCTADMCPVILNSTCVFYEGNTLTYTGITTNDSLQTALQKIDAKFGDAMVGYIFTNGVSQPFAGAPVGLGGNLTEDIFIGGDFTLAFAGNVEAAKHITTGGTSSDFVKGDGTLDSNAYQLAGNYITALTGDVIANGPGSATASLAVVNSNPGTYGSGTRIPVVTVDTKGRVTALTTTAINVPSGILSFVGDVYGSGTTGSATTLTLTNVNSNVYNSNTFLKFKVNAKGLVTGAAPITHVDIEGVLGYVPVPETRTISINGVVRDLQTNAVFVLPGGGSVTNVSATAGTGINVSVTNPTTTPNITITNTAPDQVVSIASGTGINVTGTYPNFTVAATNAGTVTAVTASSPLASSGGATPNITISQASGSTDGYLSSTDWNTFNNKEGAITPGTTSQYWRGDKTWQTLNTTVVTEGTNLYYTDTRARDAISVAQPLTYNSTIGQLGIQVANSTQDGYLSYADWNTFNNKQDAGNYITALTGEATASGPGSATVTLSTPAVTGKLLTGVNITGGSIVDTDSILTAFGKVQNQINGLIGGSIYKGTWNASTNTPTITSGVGTTGWYYIVSVPGTTNIDGITDWNLGDWIIFDGTAWQQVDNTDAVVSVNGYTGAVSLVSSDIPEGLTNLYYTPARARTAISITTTGTSGAATYDNITGVLNIPNYTTDLSGYVPNTRTLTINGTTYDLSANRSWTVAGSMPTGGTAGQILAKIDGTDYNTEWIDNFASQVKNQVKLGAALTKGTPVYVSSADGTNMIVSASSNTTEATSSKTFGLLETGGALNAQVNVVTYGLLAGLDTSAANAAGDPVWLGPNGTLLYGLVNKPYAPAHMVYIGVVTRKQSNNGEIFINVQNGFEMDELHNVSARNPANNAILAYNTSTSLWEKNTITGVLGYTPANGANYVPYTGATTNLALGDNNFSSKRVSVLKSSDGFGGYTSNYLFLETGSSITNVGTDGISLYSKPNTRALIINYDISGTGRAAILDASSLSTDRTFTFPNATGTLALTSDIPSLAGYVTIGTTQTITGTKTFSAPITASGEVLVTNGGVTGSTGVGYLVLSGSSGQANTGVGYAALSGGNSGNRNTAFGYLALASNTSAYNNTAVGHNAGKDITTGGYNTIVGSYTGTSGLSSNVILADGQGNIRFQWDGSNIKLNGNTVGSNAYTSTPYLPLAGGTMTGALVINPANSATVGLDVASNTFTLRTDTSQPFNRQLTTTLGSGTLVKLQAAGYGGTYVTDLGFYTSSSSAINTIPNLYLTGGDNRVGINTDTPAATLDVVGTAKVSSQLTLGSTITNGTYTYTLPGATGTLALISQIPSVTGFVPYTGATGAVNLGAYDLTVNGITVGIGAGNMSSNTAIGASVLASNTNGSNNAALGYFSLNSNTTGGANTAIGSQTLKSNTNGTFNIAVGYGSLFNSVSANYNTAIGNSALYNTTGSSNTAIGDGAGYNITTGIFNTLIGGYFGTSSMSYNVILSDGARNIRFQFDGTNTLLGQSGNVLINTSTNAGYKLDVNGTGRFTGALSGTSATFSGNGSFGSGNSDVTITIPTNNTGSGYAGRILGKNATGQLIIQHRDNSATFVDAITISSGGGNPVLTFGGAATFSSSVTATELYLSTSNGLVGNINSSNANGGYLTWQTSGTTIADIGTLQQIFGSGGSTNFGINARGTKDLAFGTNNTERLRITSSGSVGIGTTSPASKFQVNLTTNENVAFGSLSAIPTGRTLILQTTSTGGQIETYSSITGGYVNTLINPSGGNVGIGTTSPGRNLDINGNLRVQGGAIDLSNDFNNQIYSLSNAFYVKTNGSEKMIVTSSGNVGIGTSVISQNFAGYTHLDIGNPVSGGIILFSNGTGTNYGYVNGEAGGVNMRATVGNLTFNTGASERMRITSGGSVLVGTTSSLGFAMEVNGSIWAQKLRINDTASGYVTLEMENSSRWRINYLGRFSGYGAGTLTTDASGNISASSDRTLKDVIKPIENVLENIKDFEPVYFKWNDKTDLDKENVYMSTIAQSIQKHYPDAVGKMADGTLTVQDRAVTAILVQAIKELKAELDTYTGKNK